MGPVSSWLLRRLGHDSSVWFDDGIVLDLDEIAEIEHEFASRVNGALVTWDRLPDRERTAERFQQLAGLTRS